MTSRSSSALRKSTCPTQDEFRRKSATRPKAGKLPEWNLSDLYSGIDAPEVTRDLDKGWMPNVSRLRRDYKGKLAERTAGEGGGTLARRGGQAL